MLAEPTKHDHFICSFIFWPRIPWATKSELSPRTFSAILFFLNPSPTGEEVQGLDEFMGSKPPNFREFSYDFLLVGNYIIIVVRIPYNTNNSGFLCGYMMGYMIILVGGFNQPLWKMMEWKSVRMMSHSQLFLEKWKSWSKPPTRLVTSFSTIGPSDGNGGKVVNS